MQTVTREAARDRELQPLFEALSELERRSLNGEFPPEKEEQYQREVARTIRKFARQARRKKVR